MHMLYGLCVTGRLATGVGGMHRFSTHVEVPFLVVAGLIPGTLGSIEAMTLAAT